MTLWVHFTQLMCPAQTDTMSFVIQTSETTTFENILTKCYHMARETNRSVSVCLSVCEGGRGRGEGERERCTREYRYECMCMHVCAHGDSSVSNVVPQALFHCPAWYFETGSLIGLEPAM